MIGQLISINSGKYEIKCNEFFFIVNAAGKLRNINVKPLVGDIVEFTPNKFLTKVYKRKNFLKRPKVSNVDQAIIVSSLIEPKYSSILTNKILAIIEHNNILPIIVFTKKDKIIKSYLKEYQKQGYKVFEISNKTKEGIKNLSKVFKNKISVFIGQTGVGKSSTINSLFGFNLKTNKISKSLKRGKHTTRIIKIYDLINGQIIDTPGFSSFENDLTKFELARSYKNFEENSIKCQFNRNCLHNKEINCQIKKMVKNNKISKKRYSDYLKLLLEAK
jgi:ribosome biogenesis GTPase